MPKFTDAPAPVFYVPEGDYVLQVTAFATKISTGKKTAGADQYSIEFLVEGHNCHCDELLTDHPSCAWKIDQFVKAAGAAPPKGTEYGFVKGCPGVFIPPIGLRLYAKLVVEEWKSEKTGKTGKQNRVAIFDTDRGTLPRAEVPVEEAGAEPF